MYRIWHLVLTAALLLTTSSASAQDWILTLTETTNSELEITTDLDRDGTNLVTGEAAQLTIDNEEAVAWENLRVHITVDGTPALDLDVAGDGNPRTVTIHRDQVSAGAALELGTKVGETIRALASFPLDVPSDPPISVPTGSSGQLNVPSAAYLLTYPCGVPPTPRHLYRDEEGNTRDSVPARETAEAQVYVTPWGTVLQSALDKFDENDSLRVWVFAHPQLLPLLSVKRASEFGAAGQIRIVGGEIEGVRGLIRERQAERRPVPCGLRDFVVRDFAPGRGEVQISAHLSGTDETQLGTFDFNVSPLYTGMFTLGGAWSAILDPQFRVVASGQGDEMIILPAQRGEDELQYALFYTPFIWGKRDLEKSVPWHHRLNPAFGIVLEDISDNALVGVTFDLPHGFALTWGYHFRQVTTLSPDSGLKPGDTFVPPEDGEFALPTTSEWQEETFYAFSIDLRAFSKLLISAIGGGT